MDQVVRGVACALVGMMALGGIAAEAPVAKADYDSPVFNRAPKSETSGDRGAFRLLVLGNSTALHGIAPEIGWTNYWGMAASAKERDFAHLLWRTMEKKLGVAGDCRIHNIYEIERSFFDGFKPDKMYPEDLAWKPDYVVFAAGENAPFDGRPEAEKRWEDIIVRMGEEFRAANPKVKFVVRTPFWFNPPKNRAMLNAARRLAAAVADLGARGDNPSMKAFDRGFTHKGVAGHPGDKGMELMADSICKAFFGESAAHVYALPEGDPRCDLYQVWVDGKEIPVSAARVSAMPVNFRWPGHQREKDQTEISGFVRFEMSAPVTMTIARARDFKEVKIRPYSKGVTFTTSDRVVTFTLEKPGDYSIEFDGQHENLHVFAQPPSAYAVKKDDPKVRYFGPGVHDVGRIEMKSGETLYIDEGAVVYGHVFARDADDISILGRGILDMSRIHEKPIPIDPKLAEEQKHKGFAITNAKRWDCIRLEYCNRVKIEGITMRDSLIYYIRPICCRDIEIRNVKIIGSWRYNADGIDMHNCERVHVADCFVRTYDDAICVKGFDYAMDESEMLHDGYLHDVFKDVLIERCTVWNDWGQSLEFGAETRAREICNVTWRDCDVIRARATACDIKHCDYADIHDVLFEDIRLEFDGFHVKSVYSASAKDFDPTADAGLPRAIMVLIKVIPEYSKEDKLRGRVHDVTYRNIRVTAPSQPSIVFAGYDEEHRVTNVTIEGFFLNGKDITRDLVVRQEAFADAPVLKDARGRGIGE